MKPKNETLPVTEALRRELAKADNLLAIAKAAGVQQASLWRFAKGERSLRLDMADRLCVYFGFEIRRVRRRKGESR